MGKLNTSSVFDGISATTTAAPVAETLEQKVARLEAQNAMLLASKSGFKAGAITVKITDGGEWTDPKTGAVKTRTKGRISVYGLQRMPITLSADQWTRLANVLEGNVKVRLAGSSGNEVTFGEFCGEAEARGLLAHK